MCTRTFISVTDVRRDTARLMEQVRRSAAPIFVTQFGHVTAVLMSPPEYEALRAAARRDHRRKQRRILDLLYGPGPWDRKSPRVRDRDAYEE